MAAALPNPHVTEVEVIRATAKSLNVEAIIEDHINSIFGTRRIEELDDEGRVYTFQYLMTVREMMLRGIGSQQVN